MDKTYSGIDKIYLGLDTFKGLIGDGWLRAGDTVCVEQIGPRKGVWIKYTVLSEAELRRRGTDGQTRDVPTRDVPTRDVLRGHHWYIRSS